jgi:hypothetical protein
MLRRRITSAPVGTNQLSLACTPDTSNIAAQTDQLISHGPAIFVAFLSAVYAIAAASAPVNPITATATLRVLSPAYQ